MSYILQNLIIALNDGASYALIALGYTMVYGVLRLINFAHGDVFMIGAFVGIYIARRLNPPTDHMPAPEQTIRLALFGVIAAMLVCGLVGFLIERFAYRPLRKSPKLSALITAIGMSLLIEYLAQMQWSSFAIGTFAFWGCGAVALVLLDKYLLQYYFGRSVFGFFLSAFILVTGVAYLLVPALAKNFINGVFILVFGSADYFGPDPQRYQPIERSGERIQFLQNSLGVSVVPKDLVVWITTAVTLTVLYILVKHTRTGKAMRAVSQNYDAARLMGIDIDRVISFTFILGSMLAAIGGCLWGLNRNQCTPLMGLIPGLKAFVAAVIGGIGNIPGAAVGGLILGLIETYVSSVQYHHQAILTPYKDAIAFFILILVLLVKPEGIFGKAVPEKV